MADAPSTPDLFSMVERQLVIVQSIQRELTHAAGVLTTLNALLQERGDAPPQNEGTPEADVQAWLRGDDLPDEPTPGVNG